ncbi:ABC transporter ATP-binding protein [Rhizobium rhizogenes]|uniref:ABC transporter ATP-binding protein n=1 Tax=Rhizobium rhizogenes TaxID=359 RepID=UPI00157401BE|nr:ABC transporter ATP-binding protein [Rhizobium rhizogenes]NTH22888.1 ABC transporter ATP-binding protein [Rhizobium rhizogenes]NTH35917.1 ABC transporter ATP-binding protein [Rhizobium rhizogenes]
MFAIENLTCAYGAAIAVSDVSLALGRGEILALIGANGAGKTSTIMAAMGHVKVVSGTIRIGDREIISEPARDRPKLGLSVVPEGRRLFNDLTVEENLIVGGYTRKREAARLEMEKIYDLFPRLAERRGQAAGSMSGGEQQMLAIGRALMTAPKVLLIDELSLGLMPKMIDFCLDTIVRLKQEGLAIVLVEQNTDRAFDVADKVAVMAAGRVVASGPPSEIVDRERFFSAYLGLHGEALSTSRPADL